MKNSPPSDIITQSSNNINGYSAYYVKFTIPGGERVDYFISSKGYLVHFAVQDKEAAPMLVFDDSSYQPAFAKIVSSVTLNF
jgi:hypothetical protein